MSFVHDDQPQKIYDSFNEFIFSSDRKLFAKLASKLYFTEITKSIPGSIVELGVFKGSGLVAWLKALELNSTNHKNVYGFDFFDDESLVKSINSTDKELMKSLFKDRGFDPKDYEVYLEKIINNAGFNNFNFLKGDVKDTIPRFLKENPGFRASIINFDLDLEDPTEFCLEMLWPRVCRGGVLIFDEYAINEWTESNAVDNFCKKNNLILSSTPYFAPSAFLIKN
tara:strand:+ start:368 stop:1042 length:675 start_codon:yes stop_codon:yes gene_type:complete